MSDPQQTAPTLREEQLLVDLEAFKANHTNDAEQRGRDRRERIRQLLDSGSKHEEVQQELNQLLLEEERDSPQLKAAISWLRQHLEKEQRLPRQD